MLIGLRYDLSMGLMHRRAQVLRHSLSVDLSWLLMLHRWVSRRQYNVGWIDLNLDCAVWRSHKLGKSCLTCLTYRRDRLIQVAACVDRLPNKRLHRNWLPRKRLCDMCILVASNHLCLLAAEHMRLRSCFKQLRLLTQASNGRVIISQEWIYVHTVISCVWSS